ncbi:MAG: helix-turn-helix domain-containing protein [Oscillospiraceae bacterium]|nr:helix-turn-helix domain-containing protein [Oscillospiraceae bacterium]
MRDILAGNISRYRKDLGLTQEALADRLGITFQAVSKWETGQTIPDTMLLPRLAQTLNVSIDKSVGYSAHAFVSKPFVPPAPDDNYHHLWKSGQLFTYFHDWHIEQCSEYIFDCNSSGIPHRHAANRLYARKVKEKGI